jgi:glucose/arabinose dehydrogenase
VTEPIVKTSNALVLTAACSGTLPHAGAVAELPLSATVGPSPQLEPPRQSLIPTVEVASVAGWPPDAHPTPGAGLAVARFADGLQHPRWLYVLPNGDVLVAETNAPPKPEDGKGIKGFVMKMLMKKAGRRPAECRPDHAAS